MTRLPYFMTFLVVLIAVLSSLRAIADKSPSDTIALDKVLNPQSFLGQTPATIYSVLGKPVYVDNGYLCCNIEDYKGDFLTQAYALENGGRIGFVYAQPWHVVAVVFDNILSPQYYKLADFFPNGTPRKQRLITCVDDSFFHVLPEDQVGTTISIKEVTAVWKAPFARTFYGWYRLDDKGLKKYDPVTATETLQAPAYVDGLRLVAWALTEQGVTLGDVHLGQDSDISTLLGT